MGLIDSAVPYASAFVTDSHYHASLLQRMLKSWIGSKCLDQETSYGLN